MESAVSRQSGGAIPPAFSCCKGSGWCRGALPGAAVGLLLSTLALVSLVVRNPFLVDDLLLGVLAFVLFPGFTGGILGLMCSSFSTMFRWSRRLPRDHGSASSCWKLCAAALLLAAAACIVAHAVALRAERGPAVGPLSLMIVGIDGATWKVADPMIERGELPNLASAISSGASGVLTSIEPLYSPRIFTTIATGKVAEKHGILGVMDSTSDKVLVKRIWDILYQKLDWDYGVVEWYVTCPPRASPGGFMVPGWLATSDETIPPELAFLKRMRQRARHIRAAGFSHNLRVAAQAAQNGATLSTLAELMRIGFSQWRGDHHLDVYRRQHVVFARLLTEATVCQLRRTDVRMLAVVYKATDSLSHKYWRYHSPEAFPGTDPAAVERYGRTVEDMYSVVDEQLARLTSYLSPEGILVIVSDHGFQPNPALDMEPYALRGETLLRAFGFDPGKFSYVRVGPGVYLRAAASDETANSRLQGELEQVFSSLRVGRSDARAFNVQSVDKAGTGDDYVRLTVTDELLRLAAADPVVVASDGRSIRLSSFLTAVEWSGGHEIDGIVIMTGEVFVPGASLSDATILDVTPTILAALSLPVADDMDGRPLTEAMDAAFLASRPISSVSTYETGVTRLYQTAGSDSLPGELRERLRSLGYLE